MAPGADSTRCRSGSSCPCSPPRSPGRNSASVGPEPGRTFRGHSELEAGFRAMFEHDAGARIEQGEPLVQDEWAVSTWAYHFDGADGSQWCERGIDLWRFRDGKICLKDAYRKTRA
ncbi:nuclear transport factor 2 family protein [Nonomuraea sp. NPDC050643]|uniref:nuclear transport factor 2 family protein n=1 Tax=Nonomuraea sp. NPDC050643 TaxID=3155660 RepID=UPI0033C321A4